MTPNARTPRVTALVPAYNADAYLGQALDSALAHWVRCVTGRSHG